MRLRRLIRSPAVFWAAAIVLALVTGGIVSRIVGSAASEARRYGSLRTAIVATRRVTAGDVVTDGDIVVRRVPAAFLPADHLSSLPRRRTAVAALFPGQPVVSGQLAPDGVGGVAGLVPRGHRAVAVPTDAPRPPVRRGDRVDVLATFDQDSAGGGPPTFPVARAAPVVAVSRDAVTIEVADDTATRVVFAITKGNVSLAVVGPTG